MRLLTVSRWTARFLLLIAVTLPWLVRGAVDARLAVGDYEIIGEALHATEMDEWPRAFRLMDRIDDPLASKFFRWFAMVEDERKADFDELARFIIANPTWPRIDELQQLAEHRLTDSADQTLTRQLFEGREPLTTRGRIRLAEALLAAGEREAGVWQIKRAWTQGEFTAKEEKTFLRRHRRHLTAYDHEARLNTVLWDRRWNAAKRMLPRVSEDWQKLAKARLTLQQRSRGVDGAVAAVPAVLEKDPGLTYDRIRWRRQKKKHSDAVSLLVDPPQQIGRPDRWWYERSFQIRRAIDRRDFPTAYRLASHHGQLSGGDYAEAEWLAGWLALRFNKRPKTAFRHFVRLYDRVVAPVRQARAAYWAGRAAGAQGDEAGATAWYRRAASHHVTYYGQLAASELGEEVLVTQPPSPTESDRALFEANEVARVARMLIAAGAVDHLDAFLLQLATNAETAVDISMITELAVAGGRPSLLARLGRKAAFHGKIYDPAAFPIPRIEGLLNPVAEQVEAPLMLGLARQESMFRSGVASGAGARGLLQLIPSTARNTAKRLGMPYDLDRLIGDPNYNALLGGSYLELLLERFDGETALALAGYNAGPLRVKQWIEKHGDPRTGDRHDIVDWIELIPFDETRNYVQRVLEGYQVYRYRLADDNVALVDYSGPNGVYPPHIPAFKPRDEASALAASTGAGATVAEQVHRPRFKPLDALPGTKLAESDQSSIKTPNNTKPSRSGDAGQAPTGVFNRSFDDQDNRRVAADEGEVVGTIDRSSALTAQ